MSRARLLVVDDKESFLALFRRSVPSDLEVVCASDGATALELLARETFDVIVTDVRMPGADGMTILRKVREAGVDVEVILMTAYGTIGDAVRAMKLGAAEYLTKPFDPDDAVIAIESAIARKRARSVGGAESRTLPSTQLVAQSPAMRPVTELVARAAASDAPVLVTGERGVGKALVARTIHQKSARSSRRFVPFDCGAFDAATIEAELFGFVRGVFTGPLGARRGAVEEASGGTLFLDEIDALPPAVQMKLARAMEERVIRRVGSTEEHPIDARFIAASVGDVARAVELGTLRAELFDRLHVLSVTVPPLRERREDLPLLADALLRRAAAVAGLPPCTLSPEAMAMLVAYDWPGNVSQLENALARAVAAAPETVIDVEALPREIRAGAGARARTPSAFAGMPYREAIAVERERATREYLIALLRDVQGNVTQAAERAGIERESFHRLMKKHGVRAEDYRPR
jgi:DNA-binding NtrC family response regulator